MFPAFATRLHQPRNVWWIYPTSVTSSRMHWQTWRMSRNEDQDSESRFGLHCFVTFSDVSSLIAKIWTSLAQFQHDSWELTWLFVSPAEWKQPELRAENPRKVVQEREFSEGMEKIQMARPHWKVNPRAFVGQLRFFLHKHHWASSTCSSASDNHPGGGCVGLYALFIHAASNIHVKARNMTSLNIHMGMYM